VNRHRATTLSIALNGGEPPGEFRVFTAGVVDTTKGQFLFDEKAAALVMSEYQAHGIDLMVDYDHASLSSFSVDPAQAGKAAGWFGLEVRGGELWAVNVRWTVQAASALRAREWRFMSPAFTTDEAGRITSVLNVAITNMPATRRLEPLMAASMGACMDPKLVAEALDALVAGDAEKCAELLKGLIAAAAGGEPAPEAPEAPAVEEMAAPPVPAEGAPEEEKKVAASAILRLSGKASIVEAIAEVEAWRASHVELEGERQKLAKEREVLEAAERRKGCVDLVKLGGLAPAVVWADEQCSAPRAFLSTMPIADFRAFVASATAASSGKPRPARAPADAARADGSQDFATPHGEVTLSASELAECARAGAKPEVYAANKAQRLGREKK